MDEPAQSEPPGRLPAARLPTDLLDTAAAGPAAIRGSLIRTGGYVGSAIVGLLSVSLLIRHIGVVDFGHYVTVLSLVTLAATLSDAGLTTLGIREYTIRAPHQRDRLMANLLGLRLVLTVLGVLGAAAFALVVGYEGRLVLGTLIAGAGMLLTVLQGTFAVPLVSTLQLGRVTALDFARQVLTTAATVALVLAGGSLLGFLAIPIPVGLAILAATQILVRGRMPTRPRIDLAEWRVLLRSVLPIGLAVTVAAIYFRVTIIVMSLVASPEQTGYYATAFRVLEVIVLLPGLIVGATFPVLARAARDDTERLSYAVTRLAEAMILVGGLVALSVVLGADFAVSVITGGTSTPSVPVLQIQGVAIAIVFVATAWSFALLSLGRFGAVLAVTSVGLAVVLTLTLVLVPTLKAQGAAIAIVVAEAVQAALALRILHTSAARIGFPLATSLRVLAGGGLGLSTLLVGSLTSLERGVLGGALYAAAIVVLRGIPPELTQALRGRMPRRSPAGPG